MLSYAKTSAFLTLSVTHTSLDNSDSSLDNSKFKYSTAAHVWSNEHQDCYLDYDWESKPMLNAMLPRHGFPTFTRFVLSSKIKNLHVSGSCGLFAIRKWKNLSEMLSSETILNKCLQWRLDNRRIPFLFFMTYLLS